MGYWLGIDVGTSFIAAAICRAGTGWHEVVPLGARFPLARSVICSGADGEIIVGDAAERRAAADPGQALHPAVDHLARVVWWVIERVAQLEGGAASGITLTCPASWDAGAFQSAVDALGMAGLSDVRFCTTAQAAAAAYASRVPVNAGGTLAVYDLGGGRFEAAVVRTTGAGTFAILGSPEGIEGLGGAAFDDAVFAHVLAAVPALSDPGAERTDRLRRSVILCRRECAEARETLSTADAVTIPVLAPQVQTRVSLSRAEFEDLVRPRVEQTVEALRRTLRSAEAEPADLDAVLLVGGCARMPLVARMVSDGLGRPVVVDDDPQASIALGAAGYGLPASADSAVPAAPVPPTPAGTGDTGESAITHPAPMALPPWLSPAPPPQAHPAGPQTPPRRASPARSIRFAAAGLLGLVIAGGAVSVPLFVSGHRAPASGVPVPAAPSAGAPSDAVPRRAAPSPAAPGPDPAVTTAPAPAAPPAGNPRPRTAAPRSRPRPAQPPAPASSPTPLNVPDWVNAARG